jgi:transmembrane sensor
VSRLPTPVRRTLRSGLDEVALARVWRRVEARRRATSGGELLIRGWAAAVRQRGFGAAAMLAAVVGIVVLVWAASSRHSRDGAAGPLRTADGRELATMAEASGDARTFFLTDGSIVTLKAGATLRVLENDGAAVVALLASGGARFDVQPGGPRRWTIECGVAAIEVVGTRFSIERQPGRVRVAVEHGTVLVRGDRVPDRVEKLTDGDALEVTETGAPVAAPKTLVPSPTGFESVDASTPLPRTAASPSSGAAAQAGDPAAAASSPPWRELARRGEYSAAYALLGTSGIGHVSADGTVSDLLAVADVARLSGHPGEAVAALQHIVATYPDDPRAALAAFTLGRVELDALDDAADAADAFARAIVLGVPDGLLEDAYARLVEARARAGDRAGARRAAQTYRERFPNGTRAASIDRWLGGP